MKVLILGGSGMLGHKLYQTLAPRLTTYATVRGPVSNYEHLGIFDSAQLIGEVVAEDFLSVERALAVVQPDVVVNCIGIVKQDAAARDPIKSIIVNSLFPRRVAQAVTKSGGRVIHLSTDCVFSGRTGNYTETDLADPIDLYGRSKLLGEPTAGRALTIRTSMIGRELRGAHGLLEWFFSQRDKKVRGFTRAIFSGFTTQVLADLILKIIVGHPDLAGVWHMASDPISKFDLLTLVKQTYGLAAEIEPDESFVCDRSLDGTRFRETAGVQFPSWPEMIDAMFRDPTPYEHIRSNQ